MNKVLAGSLETGRITHAYLFVVRDTGFASGDHSATADSPGALALAARLNCDSPECDAACGKCLSSKLIQEGNHPDVRVISPDGLSININKIRGFSHDMSINPR